MKPTIKGRSKKCGRLDEDVQKIRPAFHATPRLWCSKSITPVYRIFEIKAVD